MKTKVSIAILGLSALALSFAFSQNTDSNTDVFVAADNVAFADGYTCAPKDWSSCKFATTFLADYIRVDPNPGGGNQ